MGKAKYVLVFVLIAAVLLGAPGSVANANANKITGVGWFIDDSSGNKITFGFYGKQITAPDGAYAKRQFRLVDQEAGDRIHGIIDNSVWGSLTFTGSCSINGTGDYYLRVAFQDFGKPGVQRGDRIIVTIREFRGGPLRKYYEGELKGGNIKIH